MALHLLSMHAGRHRAVHRSNVFLASSTTDALHALCSWPTLVTVKFLIYVAACSLADYRLHEKVLRTYACAHPYAMIQKGESREYRRVSMRKRVSPRKNSDGYLNDSKCNLIRQRQRLCCVSSNNFNRRRVILSQDWIVLIWFIHILIEHVINDYIIYTCNMI